MTEGPAIDDLVRPFTSRAEFSLCIATTAAGDELAGCLVGFVTQCSIRPARFLVCISKLNHSFRVVERSDNLAVHLLGADQTGLATLFGERTGDTVSKFTRSGWHRGRSGAPVLDDCAAWIDGEIAARFDTGDHQAILIRPVDGGVGDRSGVLTFQSAPHLRAGHPARG